MSLGVISAIPTLNLCYDIDGRGIECYNSLYFDLSFYYPIDEWAIWNRTLYEEQVFYLGAKGEGRNGMGYTCYDYYVLEAYNRLINSSGGIA